jgi:hypothetical protein
MTLLVLLVVAWLALSPVFALVCGAFMRAGRGPRVDAPLRLLPGREDGSRADRGSRADTSPLEDRAA